MLFKYEKQQVFLGGSEMLTFIVFLSLNALKKLTLNSATASLTIFSKNDMLKITNPLIEVTLVKN